MTGELRKTGIGIVGDAPWGTHGCLFYETRQDLLDTVVAFFKSGLEHRQLCIWITSEPLNNEDAFCALRQSISNLDQYLDERSMQVIPCSDWYLERGVIDSRRVMDLFRDKLRGALANGYAGIRITGDSSWLGRSQRTGLLKYENELNAILAGQRAMVLCTYPIAQTGAAELLDVARAHSVCVSVRQGDWEIIDTPELKEAKQEIKKLNQLFEQKVVERTHALRTAIEELKKEIDERRRVEEALRSQKEVLQKIFDHIPVMIAFVSPGNHIKLVNREWERTLGWTLEEIHSQRLDIVRELYPDPREQQQVWDFISASSGQWTEFKTKLRDGRVIDTSWANVHLSDGTSIGFGRDITERKESLEQLQTTAAQMRALSASIQAGREEERSRVARTIHDELGSAFTSLKWDLESLDKALAVPVDALAAAALRAKIAAMLKLADNTIQAVRRIAWELRPRILDDLGLMEAIESQMQQFEARTGILCRHLGFPENVGFNQEQSTALFRIFQEALTNILRHARATRVDIGMTHQDSEFVLTIRDNGRGIAGVEKSGLGILGMQERARLVGGKIDIQGSQGAGTTIAVRVPIAGSGSAVSAEVPKAQ